jgi:hypothetical protein
MKPIRFAKAFYIKLGKGGMWEESSIKGHKARIGWSNLTLEEINQRDWKAIKKKRQPEYRSKGAATMDINALKSFVESTPDDIWITFHARQLWWCRLGEPEIFGDEISRYRWLAEEWQNRDVNGYLLLINQIPGSISKVQRFQGAICKIKEVDDLRRLINDQPSEVFQAISKAKETLVAEIEKGLRRLHWRDFETLADLLFRNAGWRRISLLGETMKYVDMELEEPVTGDLYQVQVKSAATVDDFKEYIQSFSHGSFRKLYFVVHSPEEKLADYQAVADENVELILPGRLAQMVVEFGLTDWLSKKVR